LVIPYLLIAHGQLLAQLHVRIVYRLVVQLTKDELAIIVAVFNEQPHPRPDAELLIFDLNLDVIALFYICPLFAQTSNHKPDRWVK
jgi:hypothetical protein